MPWCMNEAQIETSRTSPKHSRASSNYTPSRSGKVEKYSQKVGYEYDLSSEDHYLDNSYVTGHEQRDSSVSKNSTFHSGPTGPPHLGLRYMKPIIKRCENLLSYRSYRLLITSDTMSSRETADVRVHIKNRNITVKNHKFDDTDLIRDYDSLVRFLNEPDMLYMSEAQAFVTLSASSQNRRKQSFAPTLSGNHVTVALRVSRRQSSISFALTRQLLECAKSSRIFSTSNKEPRKAKKNTGRD